MKIKHIILPVSLFLLGACATPYDVKISESNNQTIQVHKNSEAVVADSKTSAIKDIFAKIADKCDGQDSFSCGALLGLSGAMASRDIAGIKTEEYKGPVQKTGLDVQEKAVDRIGEGIPILGMTVVSKQAIKKDKGTIINQADNGSSVDAEYKEEYVTNISDGAGQANNAPGPEGGTIDNSTGHNTDDHSQELK